MLSPGLLTVAVVLANEPMLTSDADGFWCVEVRTETHGISDRGIATAVEASGGVFFVADGRSGLLSLTTVDGKPRRRSRVSFGDDYVKDVALDGRGHVWVAGEGFGVAVVDGSNAPDLRLIGTYREIPPFKDLPFGPQAIESDGEIVWVVFQHQVVVFSTKDVLHPQLLAEDRQEFQDALSLRRIESVLIAEFVEPLGGGTSRIVTRLFDVRDPTRLLRFKEDLIGQVLMDGDKLFAATPEPDGLRLSSLSVDAVNGLFRLDPIGQLPAHDRVVAIADDRVFVARFPQGLDVLAFPSLQLIGGIIGNFETGFSHVARHGNILASATRFGGTQFIDLNELAQPQQAVRRFQGKQITRSRFHGDFMEYHVQTGDTVSGLMVMHDLVDPKETWRARLTSVKRLNSEIADLDWVRPGDRVFLPIPRRIFCRSALHRGLSKSD